MRMLENPQIDFIKYRKVMYGISAFFVLACIVGLIIKGPTFGIEFKGGKSYVVHFEKSVPVEDIREVLNAPLAGSPEVKTYGSDLDILIKTDFEGTIQQVQDIIMGNLGQAYTDNAMSVEKSSIVSPRFADDLWRGAVNSLIFGVIVIFLYILIRFKNWSYSLGAVVALIHDVMAVLGIFVIFAGIAPFSMEIDQTIIAALLTILGFSVNDTVIIYDRIRENLTLHKTMEFKDLVNKSLNDTLSRTVITQLCVLFVVIVLFIFGGEVLKGLSFALIIGTFFGSYSSLYVATGIVYEFDKLQKKQ